VTLIGVKSKYGSCSGNCTGLININNIIRYIDRVSCYYKRRGVYQIKFPIYPAFYVQALSMYKKEPFKV
jgi:hypothetical protein